MGRTIPSWRMIVEDELEKAAREAKKGAVIAFVRKLKLHAKTEEALTYPTVLMAGKLLKQDAVRNSAS